ncbi:DUF4262 domain-containing protein [Chitinophaga solisilvae]|uniref:DUF4262 domain-containing protein n=1 Tax=Chitinophaga solisilvae TaxID=1233460 RepID=UPI00136D9830|nr:DUF4262 domain-containing protein [Chitinophaga solisilvae]
MAVSNKKIQKGIDKDGCFFIVVPPENHVPGYVYSIGLFQKFNHPEIICIGLEEDDLGTLVNNACELVKRGQTLCLSTNYTEFLQGVSVQFLLVDKLHYPYYLNEAIDFYDSSDYPAIQLIWPDEQGLFPWEPEYNSDYKFLQPLLDRDTDFRFFEERNQIVVTTSHVLDGKPILYISCNKDGVWQFHSEKKPKDKDARLVSLETITQIEPLVNEFYFLTLGQRAWRESEGSPWSWE